MNHKFCPACNNIILSKEQISNLSNFRLSVGYNCDNCDLLVHFRITEEKYYDITDEDLQIDFVKYHFTDMFCAFILTEVNITEVYINYTFYKINQALPILIPKKMKEKIMRYITFL